jgi:hypothetical protein
MLLSDFFFFFLFRWVPLSEATRVVISIFISNQASGGPMERRMATPWGNHEMYGLRPGLQCLYV